MQPLLAQQTTETYWQFARLQAMTEWWHWLVLVAVSMSVLAYVIVTYRRDSVELRRGVGAGLTLLRILAFAGILFYFLDLEKRSQVTQTTHSRVAILLDTSQSMGLRDQVAGQPGPSRISMLIQQLKEGSLLPELRKAHDVVLYKFDQEIQPTELGLLPKTVTTELQSSEEQLDATEDLIRRARMVALIGLTSVAIGLLAFGFYSLVGRRRAVGENQGWSLLVGMVFTIAGVILVAVASLRLPEVMPWDLVRQRPAELASQIQQPDEPSANASAADEPDIDYGQQLIPKGVATRLGDALRYVINKERGGSLAGLVVVSDGASNAGIDYELAVSTARAANVPIFPIGLGSNTRPANVRVVDIEAPRRVYPGDAFTITGYVQAFGFPGRTVAVSLVSAPKEAPTSEELEDEVRVKLGDDGVIDTLKFEVTPDVAGEREYRLKVAAPSGDFDETDNLKKASVQIVERKNRVLILAGGPSRDYRFLRVQLNRDRETIVDVLLQSGDVGISQEANEVLTEFPTEADELFKYDCIIGFDPNWTELSEEQIRLLDRWVAENAGGLIVVAGAVNTGEWANLRRGRDSRIDMIRDLYPVVFYSQGAPTFDLGRFGGEEAWPLNFTREGREAEFLWLEDNQLDSEAAWQTFGGVYGYFAVKDPKPGARVYARFSDPDTSIDGELPIYMAAHFYGSGRVFFQASSELWRIRELDTGYFETYYTKLIRWISQGRLLRDSSRGVLLVDKDRCFMGDELDIRAMLNDAQHQPLTEQAVPAVVIAPNGDKETISLRQVTNSSRQGMYSAQYTVLQEGDYRIELAPPGATEDELLERDVRVRVPELEIEKPERDDAILSDIAERTKGSYFVGFDPALADSQTEPSLFRQLVPQDQVAYLPGTPDSLFEKRLMTWLMGIICGVLCLEWIIRRLSRLA